MQNTSKLIYLKTGFFHLNENNFKLIFQQI